MHTDTEWQPAHPLWVFIDESGNFDFSERGTKHFLMTAVATTDPAASAARMLALKYEQMLRGSNQLDFHAVHNSHGTRLRVLELINTLESLRSRTFIIDKQEESTGEISNILETLSTAIAQWSLSVNEYFDYVTFVFDTAFTQNQSERIKHQFKVFLGRVGIRPRIIFHRVANEPNGQIADYIAWSHFRGVERHRDEFLKMLDSTRHELQWLTK